jgi:hypothetical protein
MRQLEESSSDIETIWSVYQALGGEKRPYHPHFSMNDRASGAIDPLEQRPEDKRESWGRPHLGRYTQTEYSKAYLSRPKERQFSPVKERMEKGDGTPGPEAST